MLKQSAAHLCWQSAEQGACLCCLQGDLDVFARYVITNRAFLFKRAIDSSVLQHALAKLISLQPYISGR